MSYIRNSILQGELPLPGGDTLLHAYPKHEQQILKLWRALWYNFTKNENPTNTTYWYDKFECPKTFNLVLMALCKAEWVISHSIPERNWAELSLNKDKLLNYVSEEELAHVRATFKYQQYTLTLDESKAARIVRINGKSEVTGLVREGFRKAGETQFGYDMDALQNVESYVQMNLTKSMDKIRDRYPDMYSDEASYDNVSRYIYSFHKTNKTGVFTTGTNLNDSRGRAISQSLKRVANPISCKDFRASLIITQE